MSSSPQKRVGHLIIIEGGDGTGKSTQLKILQNRLLAEGRRVATYDFPNKSGTPIGNLIGDFLRGKFGQVTPEFLALAFAADRLVARASIVEELDAGSTVLCDRYVASNVAFQGAKIQEQDRRQELEAMLHWLEYDVYQLPRPDLEIALIASDKYYRGGTHLNRSADHSREYSKGSADIHETAYDLQCMVNSYYRTLPEEARLKRIDIEESDGRRRTVDDVAQLVWQAVNALP